MARLYANENFPVPVVEELRRLGHDVLTIHETGRGGQAIPDVEVIRFASADGRAVVTLNRKHFIALHESHRPHAGIIVCTLDLDFVRQAQRIHQALSSNEPLPDRLIRINRPS